MEVLEAKAEGTEVEMNPLSRAGVLRCFPAALRITLASREDWSLQTLDGSLDDLGSFP